MDKNNEQEQYTDADFTDIFDMSSAIINGLFPVFLIPLAIALFIGIIGIIAKTFMRIIK